MKFAIAFAVLLAAGVTAQAKLSPFDGTREAKVAAKTDVVSLYTGPAGAEMERSYFQAPQPQESYRADRCTVQTFVFSKMTLAQACY